MPFGMLPFHSRAHGAPVDGRFALPDGPLPTLRLSAASDGFALVRDPLPGIVRWQGTRVPSTAAR